MKYDQTTVDLLKAAQIMRERGWCQGSLQNGAGGPVCLWGAIYVAIYGDAYPANFDEKLLQARRLSVHGRLSSFICKNYSDKAIGPERNIVSLAAVNDSADCTQEKAIAMLQGAAEMLLRAK